MPFNLADKGQPITQSLSFATGNLVIAINTPVIIVAGSADEYVRIHKIQLGCLSAGSLLTIEDNASNIYLEMLVNATSTIYFDFRDYPLVLTVLSSPLYINCFTVAANSQYNVWYDYNA